jgi:tetratricopeptide (TPR) repeat protein
MAPRSLLLILVAVTGACSQPKQPANRLAPAAVSCDVATGPSSVEPSPTADDFVRRGSEYVRLSRVSSAPDLYRNAEACVAEALTRQPAAPAALRLRGLVLMNDHAFTQARDLAAQMLERDPNDALTWGTKSDAELELGDTADAIASAQRMLDLKPNLPAYGRAAHLRWLQGDISGAKRLYELAIASGTGARDPEPRAWMIVQAAWLFWHEGDYKGAAAGFELARTNLPEYAPALEGLGRTALAAGDYRAATTWLERARKARSSIETTGWLGDAYSLLGKRDRAQGLYAEVERDGRKHDPRTLAAFYTSHDREPAAALALATAEYALRKDVTSKEVLAFALYRNGRLEEANRLAHAVVATGILDARALYQAGLIQTAAASNDVERQAGRALMQDAFRRNPGFDRILTGQPNSPLARR